MNISLDYEDFKCLVRGGVLIVGPVKIVLKDIGFHMMDEAINLADSGVDIHKDHTKFDGGI